MIFAIKTIYSPLFSEYYHLIAEYYHLLSGSLAIIAVLPVIVVLWCIGLLFLLLRWWKTGLLFLVVGLGMNWYTQSIPLNPLSWRRVYIEQKEEGTLRILEYNICHKPIYLERNVANYQQLADFLLSKDADVLVLPEHMKPHALKLDSILSAHYPYNFDSVLHGGYEEDAVYSRYPITRCKHYVMNVDSVLVRHPDVDQGFLNTVNGSTMTYELELDMNGQPLTLIYVHLRSNGYDHAKDEADRRRDKLRSVLESMRHNYAFRDAEAECICDSLAQLNMPLLICGDFNDVSGSYVLNTLQHRLGLQDAWWERGLGPGFTFDDQHLLLRLDHLLYSSHFELLGVSLLSEADFSDHEPLLFDLKLK